MLIDMRNGLMAGGGLSAKSYVQDGLVAMWDGIENAGFGTHDANATVWKDLSGNENTLTLENNAHFASNCLVSANRNLRTALIAKTFPFATIEVCCFKDAARNSSALICFGNSTDNHRMLMVDAAYFQIYNVATLRQPSSFDSAGINTFAGVYDAQNVGYVNSEAATPYTVSNTWGTRTGYFGLSGSSNYSSYNFVGNYYSVRLYSRALTADEIAHNYVVDRARFNLPDAT